MSTQEQTNDMTDLEAARAAARAPKTYRAPVDEPGGRRQSATPAVLQVWSSANYTPTPSLDPGIIKAIEGYEENEGYLAPALNAFSTAHETLKQVAAARDPLSRDTSKSEGQKLLAMAARSEKAQERITKTFDTAHKNLSSAAQALEESLSQPLEASASGGFSVEIRKHIKSLPKDERGEFVGEAMKRGDYSVLNAVLGAPAYLSGVTDAHKDLWLRQFHEARNPQAVRRLAAYRKALELIETRGPLVFTEMEKAQGGKWSDVKRLRGQSEASDAALAAISIGG
jgi:hypothetical protein